MGSNCCKKSDESRRSKVDVHESRKSTRGIKFNTPPNRMLCDFDDDSYFSRREFRPRAIINPYPFATAGDDTWVSVKHGGPFPKDAVRAMDRELNNTDPLMKNCYVALWFKDDGPIFGRACNNKGKVEAWFSNDGADIPSSAISTTINILTYPDPATQKFRYSWIPIGQLNSVACTTVRQGEYSAVVVRDLHLATFCGELLGKTDLEHRSIGVGHSGKQYHFTEPKIFENAYVLCRVPNYGLPRELMVGDDAWVSVRHGGPFPKGAVRAMDRELNNSGLQTKNCYVAVWTQRDSGKPIFGRAMNANGKIEAVFPTGIKEFHSSSINGTFSILTYHGPPKQNFCYAWIPIQQMKSMACQPIQQHEFSPVVIPELQLGSFSGELLGNGHLERGTVSFSYSGKVYNCTEKQYQNGYVLCRVPNFRAIKPIGIVGDEERVSVVHHGPFPKNAVQAMGRQLQNNDVNAKTCYVALWFKPEEPVFGRAWNNKGKVEALFPWAGQEHRSADIGTFSILIYSGPPKQNYRYEWIQINQLKPSIQPVRQGEYSPVVIPDLKIASFQGELLGKVNLERRMAWVSVDGKEFSFTKKKFETAFILCRVPLK